MEAGSDKDADPKKPDPLRDPPLRYLGYANEVGEAFRSLVHVNLVRASYGVASGYVVADAIHKGCEANQKHWVGAGAHRSAVSWAVVDTIIWQGLASVLIPGFTINRACAMLTYALRKTSSLPVPVQKWTVTCAGLALIPFIIEPIDRSVDTVMERTLRRYFQYEDETMHDVVKHHRND